MEEQEDKRPWQKEKLSWIYYIDKIKDDPDFIYSEVDGNSFMFDGETGRLSIWSQKWGSFMDVGVRRFLEQAEGVQRGEVSRGTRIFYKGIELQNMCIERDTELLEFIDIKADLDRSYINISRGGFTDKGKNYFEQKLHPGLLDAVKIVLRHIEKQAEKDEKNSIRNLIRRIVEEKCKEIVFKEKGETSEELDKKRKNLVSLLVSVSILSYFAMRTEWDILEKLDVRKEQDRIWHLIVKDIDEILSKKQNEELLSELSEMTKFFDLIAYSEKYRETVDTDKKREVCRYNFVQIFLPENHWAIMQKRSNSLGQWSNYLILLDDGKEDESNFKRLEKLPRSKSDEEILEEWGGQLCSIPKDSNSTETSNQQFILNWMLKSIPTIAMFSNQSGNTRVNVLANRIYPSIYVNRNFKYLIVDRILENANREGYQRFSTITWQRREYIGCKDLPFSIYFIKRGYLSYNSYYRTIIPFEGKLLKKWYEKVRQGSQREYVRKLDNLWNKLNHEIYFRGLQCEQSDENKEINQFLAEMGDSGIFNLSSTIFDFILIRAQELQFRPCCEFKELLELDKQRYSAWRDIYHDIAECYLLGLNKGGMDEEELKARMRNLTFQITINPQMDSLCSAWMYLSIYKETVINLESKVEECYNEYLKNSTNYTMKEDKMVHYLGSQLRYSSSEERIRENVKELKEELVELITELETRPIREFLEVRVGREKIFSKKINAIYTYSQSTQGVGV